LFCISNVTTTQQCNWLRDLFFTDTAREVPYFPALLVVLLLVHAMAAGRPTMVEERAVEDNSLALHAALFNQWTEHE
jgi:hypothetical protein